MYNFDDYEIERQIRETMRLTSLEPLGNISLRLDGTIHRYKVQGDRGSEENGSGAYCIWTDHWPVGWIYNWRTGEHVSWAFNRDELDEKGKSFFTDEKYKELLTKAKKAQEHAEEIAEKKHKEAADIANTQFSAMPFASENFPYLKAKNVHCYGLRWRPDLKKIAVPLYDINGNIKSLQWIDDNGEKRFFEGSSTKEAFFSIGLDLLQYEQYKDTPILIGEGYATVATVYELTGYPCIAAMTCGNLLKIAEAIKGKYPKNKIIFVADNDHLTEGNPGITCAVKANETLDLNGVVFPKFKRTQKGTDWNDFASIHGGDETAAILRHEIFVHLQNQQTQELLRKVNFINADDLRHIKFEPLKWAVDGFLPAGLSILAGGPKVGKSILALHLSVGVAIGGCVLGKINVQQGDVLYLALEDNQRRLQERISSSSLLGDDTVSLSHLTLVTAAPRQNEGGLDYIRWWLINHPEARLVIIDTLQMFRKQLSGKGSMYSEDYEVISEIKKLADEFDVPFLVIHHLKKAKEGEDWLNKISGSQGIAGAADSIFVLERARIDNGGILHRTGRDVEEMDFAMKLDGFGWVLQGEAEQFTMPEWKRQIVNYLKEHGKSSPSELSEVLNVNAGTMRKNLQRLVQEGLIEKVGFGSYNLAK